MIENLEMLADHFHQSFQAQTQARDQALNQSRVLTRHCAQAIRAIHRSDWDLALSRLAEAGSIVKTVTEDLEEYPQLFYAGYTQDAFKEYAEANIVYALVRGDPLPEPDELGLSPATYLKGLAESVGEMRRRCLDILRGGYSENAETLLGYMDEIYGVLVTMDYPEAVTMGLRRLTDLVRSLNERTRGDITLSFRQQQLETSLRSLESRLEDKPGGP
ncbi:MAG: haloacid dehalogenase [Anaerolineales bacterium]|nr:haloacid dehalogenase [Anaerolineales bacterium]